MLPLQSLGHVPGVCGAREAWELRAMGTCWSKDGDVSIEPVWREGGGDGEGGGGGGGGTWDVVESVWASENVTY